MSDSNSPMIPERPVTRRRAGGIRLILELLDRPLHPLPRLRIDHFGAINHVGDRFGRDSSQSGDIMDGNVTHGHALLTLMDLPGRTIIPQTPPDS